MAANRREFLLSAATMAVATSVPPNAFAAPRPSEKVSTGESPFLLGFHGNAVSSLRFAKDAFATDYVAKGQALGHVEIAWRRPQASWQHLRTAEIEPIRGSFRGRDDRGKAIAVTFSLRPAGRVLRWKIGLRNLSSGPIEIGDVALPLPMHSSFDGKEPPTASVLKHSFISGHGSFLFWMRSNSVGPYLVMTPEPSTWLEYWDHLPPEKGAHSPFRAYVHSVAVGEAVQAAGGRWRQPRSSVTLSPAGEAGAERDYAFQFAWAHDYDAVRQRIVDAGLVDVEVVPGMTVPRDLSACIALRARGHISDIVAEHPDQTTLESLGRRGEYEMYRVRFQRLGENMLTVKQGKSRVTRLEFFATEPLETLIHKRAAFIARHQVRDAGKWYNGLLAEWNMDSQTQLGPDNYDRIRGWRIYEVTCDDPGLSKPAYLASKNAEFPTITEIEALDDYIEHFVWGGLQRTTEESDSFGIYGIPDWKHNRESADPGSKGKLHIWRCYDYSHIVVMYFGMYRIARDYPGVATRLDRLTYLQRAYGTALAMFTVPMRVVGWSAYETGFYNERVIPQLIEELDALGKHEEAMQLRTHWEKKVAFFLSGGPNLFGSEYAFDSTGFESTQAIARYALDHPGAAGSDPRSAAVFARTQIRANLFCRGVIEKAYYYYGSDYRGGAGDSFTLSYMSPMGGWGVLNHALHDRTEPDATIRLGYASILSSWALMNTGDRESGFGYWFPGEANDGGTGGGFEPAAYGKTWLDQPHHRGPWYYSCETDLGYCGALRSAATIVADDPVFGNYCFGGDMHAGKGSVSVIPRDGVRRRLHLRTDRQQIDFELTGARFAREKPIHWSARYDLFRFSLETESTASNTAEILIQGLAEGRYRVTSGQQVQEIGLHGKQSVSLQVPAGSREAIFEICRT